MKILLLTLIALALPLFSDNVEVQSVTGAWNNAAGNKYFSKYNSGQGTNHLQWGINIGYGQSGYTFVGSAAPVVSNIPINTPFLLGTFTHDNFTILAAGGDLTSVNLNVSVNFAIDGQNANLSGTYTFLHNETPNVGATLSDPINNDIVSFVNNSDKSAHLSVNGIAYTLTIVGFSQTIGGPLTQQFSTIEQQKNSAFLYAVLTSDGVAVPEPSTYLLLGTLLCGVLISTKTINSIKFN